MADAVRAASSTSDILVVAGPIWLGDNSSITKQVIERLYAGSSMTNAAGQYVYYGKVGGRDHHRQRGRHQALLVQHPLQPAAHRLRDPAGRRRRAGSARPAPARRTWTPAAAARENEFTQRNTTFMTWNLMHLAALLKRGRRLPGRAATSAPSGMPARGSTTPTPSTASHLHPVLDNDTVLGIAFPHAHDAQMLKGVLVPPPAEPAQRGRGLRLRHRDPAARPPASRTSPRARSTRRSPGSRRRVCSSRCCSGRPPARRASTTAPPTSAEPSWRPGPCPGAASWPPSTPSPRPR